MFFKKIKPRSFEYKPRFYNPGQDEEEKRKRKLGFRSIKKRSKRKGSIIYFAIIFIIVLYLFLKFGGIQ